MVNTFDGVVYYAVVFMVNTFDGVVYYAVVFMVKTFDGWPVTLGHVKTMPWRSIYDECIIDCHVDIMMGTVI